MDGLRVFEKTDQSITKYEAKKALKKIKAEKAVGLDGVVTEYLKM